MKITKLTIAMHQGKVSFASIFIFLVFFSLTIWWMRGWFGDVLPLSPREENIPELSYLWNLYHAIGKGYLFSDWNPLTILGSVNLIQRGYLIFAPIAWLSYVTAMSPGTLYTLLVGAVFFVSGLGMSCYIKDLKASSLAALIGGFLYMFAPAHIAIGIEGFDFNVYWAIIPWIMVFIERYIRRGNSMAHAAGTSLLLCIALFSGNTYFIATMPFFGLFIISRLMAKKQKQLTSFLLRTVLLFFSFSAFITLPSIFEAQYSWISQETLRKGIINLISPIQLLSLFLKRFQGYSVLKFDFGGNFTDMSWYLGMTTVAFAIMGITSIRKRPTIVIPLLLLIVSLLPLYGLRLPFVKFAVLRALDTFPYLQSLYDHTFRMFLLVVFSLSVLAGLGVESLRQRLSNKAGTISLLVLFLLAIWDLSPYAAFFRSIPLREFEKEGQILEKINTATAKGRYWSPFPYAQHLPRYREEYWTRYIDRNRLNTQYLYVPFAPRYSEEIFEVLLTGALEVKTQPMDVISTLLYWGNVDFIVLHPQIADYTEGISYFSQNGFTMSYQSERLVILERKEANTYVHLSTNFQPAEQLKNTDPLYWYESYKQGVTRYSGRSLGVTSSGKKLSDGAVYTLRRIGSDHIWVHVTVSEPTLVSISEAWYPGWKAFVDTKEQTIVRANYALVGTFVPKGEHEIIFAYKKPWYYTIGKYISFLSLGITIFIFLRSSHFGFFLRRLYGKS